VHSETASQEHKEHNEAFFVKIALAYIGALGLYANVCLLKVTLSVVA
jgi:hypothetical protein